MNSRRQHTHVHDRHTQDDERWSSLVQQALDDDEGRTYLARPKRIREGEDGLQARGMRGLLDVIGSNRRSFPHIRAELLNFLPPSLEIRLLLVEQYLEGLRGNTVATLGDCMGYPLVEPWTVETVTFNGHSVLSEARGDLFRITDTTTANQGCAGGGMLQVALQLRPIGFTELMEPV